MCLGLAMKRPLLRPFQLRIWYTKRKKCFELSMMHVTHNPESAVSFDRTYRAVLQPSSYDVVFITQTREFEVDLNLPRDLLFFLGCGVQFGDSGFELPVVS